MLDFELWEIPDYLLLNELKIVLSQLYLQKSELSGRSAGQHSEG